MIKTVRVSEKGQIAIPLSIRKEMGIDRGDDLVLIQKGDKLLLEKANRIEKELIDDFRDVLKFSEKALKTVWDNKEDNLWNKSKK